MTKHKESCDKCKKELPNVRVGHEIIIDDNTYVILCPKCKKLFDSFLRTSK